MRILGRQKLKLTWNYFIRYLSVIITTIIIINFFI